MQRSNRSRPTTHGTHFGTQISIGDIICKHGATKIHLADWRCVAPLDRRHFHPIRAAGLARLYVPTTDSRSAVNKFYHSITSSAWASSKSGILRRRALAVLRLTTSSTLVLCWIGRSVGWAPFKIFPARSARPLPGTRHGGGAFRPPCATAGSDVAARTGGVPLFVEEVTRLLLERGGEQALGSLRRAAARG
jgi:hypothetical protein